MPRTKQLKRRNGDNSRIVPPQELQQYRRGMFGRTAHCEVHETSKSAIPYQQGSTVASKLSKIASNGSLENNDSSFWAKWSLVKKSSAEDTVNTPSKPHRKRPVTSKNNSIDNSRYILAVNQGRNFVKIDSSKRSSSQKIGKTQHKPETTQTKVDDLPQKQLHKIGVDKNETKELASKLQKKTEMLTRQHINNTISHEIVDVKSSLQGTKANEIRKPQMTQLNWYEHSHKGNKTTNNENTRQSEAVHHTVIEDSSEVMSTDPHRTSETPYMEKTLTEYEYYQKLSANGGRLGIDRRIDVFEPKMISQQKYDDDDLESIRFRRVLSEHTDHDDDSTTITTTKVSTCAPSITSIVTQSPTQNSIVGEPGKKIVTRMDEANTPGKHVAYHFPDSFQENDPSFMNVANFLPQQTFDNTFSRYMEDAVFNDADLPNSRKEIDTENILVPEVIHKTKSHVDRLVESKNTDSSEIIKLHRQANNQGQLRKSSMDETINHRYTPILHETYESNLKSISTDYEKATSRDFSNLLSSSETQEIDRLLAILDPMVRAVKTNVPIGTSSDWTSKSPPLHNSPRKKYPVEIHHQKFNRDLVSETSSDGDFNKSLKAEAFAAFDDDTDNDTIISNPYPTSSLKSKCVHDSVSVAKNAYPKESLNSFVDGSNNRIPQNISLSASQENVKQTNDFFYHFFQTDANKPQSKNISKSSKHEENLQHRNLQSSLNVNHSVKSTFKSDGDTTKNHLLSITQRTIRGDKNTDADDNTLQLIGAKRATSSMDKAHNEQNVRTEQIRKRISFPFVESDKTETPMESIPKKILHDKSYTYQNPTLSHDNQENHLFVELEENRNVSISQDINDLFMIPIQSSKHNEIAVPFTKSRSQGQDLHPVSNYRCFASEQNTHHINTNNMDTKDQSQIFTKTAKASSNNRGMKQGYASAPIRKYWLAYSNIRSGGSFDTISLKNEGGDENSSKHMSHQQVSETRKDTTIPERNVLCDDIDKTSNHHRTTIKCANDDKYKKSNSHSVSDKPRLEQHVEVAPLTSNAHNITAIHSTLTHKHDGERTREFKISNRTNENKNDNSFDAGKSQQNDGLGNGTTLHSSTSLAGVLKNHQEVPISNRYHAGLGQLFDDEGFNVDLSTRINGHHNQPTLLDRRVPSRTFQQRFDNPAFVEEIVPLRILETPAEVKRGEHDDLNSPETDFLNFTTASQLATQEFSTQVRKSISPTKRRMESSVFDISSSKIKRGITSNDMDKTDTHIGKVETLESDHVKYHESDCVQYQNITTSPRDSYRSLSSNDLVNLSSEPIHDKNLPSEPINEEQVSYKILYDRRELLRSKITNSEQQINTETCKYDRSRMRDNSHISQAPRSITITNYPSFDSDIAIAADIVEILSMASSNDMCSPSSLPVTESDITIFNSAAVQRSNIPILPPWQHEVNEALTNTEVDQTPIERLRTSQGEPGESIQRIGRPQPGSHWNDTNESVYRKDLPPPLRDTLIHAMSPILSGDSAEEDSVSEWSSRYEQSRAGQSESFHQQCCSFLSCFDLTNIEEQIRTICNYKLDKDDVASRK